MIDALFNLEVARTDEWIQILEFIIAWLLPTLLSVVVVGWWSHKKGVGYTYTLREMMVWILACAVVIWLIASERTEYQSEKRFANEVNEIHGILYGSSGRLRGAVLTCLVDDAWLSRLQLVPRLEMLYLDGTKITDAGMKEIGELHNLRVLSLKGTRLSDVGISQLRTLKSLEQLYLDNTNVSVNGLAILLDFENLNTLSLNGIRLDETTIVRLGTLKSLEVLEIKETGINQDAIRQLQVAIQGLTIIQ